MLLTMWNRVRAILPTQAKYDQNNVKQLKQAYKEEGIVRKRKKQ